MEPLCLDRRPMRVTLHIFPSKGRQINMAGSASQKVERLGRHEHVMSPCTLRTSSSSDPSLWFPPRGIPTSVRTSRYDPLSRLTSQNSHQSRVSGPNFPPMNDASDAPRISCQTEPKQTRPEAQEMPQPKTMISHDAASGDNDAFSSVP